MTWWQQNRFLVIPQLAASLAAGIAILVLAGWGFKLQLSIPLLHGLQSMKANAALSFLLLAIALYLSNRKGHVRLQVLLSSLAVGIGALTLFEYLVGRSLGVDQLLFADTVQTRYPGRMSFFTAVSIVLLGCAFLSSKLGKGIQLLRELMALLVIMMAMFAIVGYVYGVPALYGSLGYRSPGMALHTGVTLMVLASGFLSVPREDGLIRIFRGNSIASMMARFLMPVAILTPIVLGFIFMHEPLNKGHLPVAMALSVVSTIVLLVALIWYFSFTFQRTEIERAALRQQAQTDRLTGIYNRAYFDITLEHEVERCRRYGTPLSLIMFDLDHFKVLNDMYGHLTGDRALFRVARLCEQHLRATDVFCRYGGEEFVVIAPETTPYAAMMLARRIREDIATVRLDRYKEAVTISAGVAAWDSRFLTKEDLIAAADEALYRAKQSGRNCECLYGDSNLFATASTSDQPESGASAS